MRLSSSALVLSLIAAFSVADAASARIVPTVGGKPAVTRTSRRTLRQEVRAESLQRGLERRGRIVSLEKSYESKALGFQIRYPAGWQLNELLQEDGNLLLAVMFLSPEENGIRQNVNLVMETLPEALTLDEYSRISIGNEATFLDDFKLIGSERTTVAGRQAQRVDFTANAGGATSLRFRQAWFIENGIAHVWTFADGEPTFAKNVATFEKMLETLTVE